MAFRHAEARPGALDAIQHILHVDTPPHHDLSIVRVRHLLLHVAFAFLQQSRQAFETLAREVLKKIDRAEPTKPVPVSKEPVTIKGGGPTTGGGGGCCGGGK
jgi:hypothetical protein